MAFTEATLKAAHRHSIHHQDEIRRSIECGCFHCLAVFRPAAITDWADEAPPTALCPKCGIDSVIGDASGHPVHDPAFLQAMHDLWFSNPA